MGIGKYSYSTHSVKSGICASLTRKCTIDFGVWQCVTLWRLPAAGSSLQHRRITQQLNADTAWHFMLMARVCRKVWGLCCTWKTHTHTHTHNLWGVESSKHWSDPLRSANERGNGGPSLISRRDHGSNWHQAETFQSLSSSPRQTKGVTLLLFSPLPYYCSRSVTSSVTGRSSAFVPSQWV